MISSHKFYHTEDTSDHALFKYVLITPQEKVYFDRFEFDMPLLEKQLYLKKSEIPKAGKGLFTKRHILKGTCIVEYKGRVTTWKKFLQTGIFNGYVYYINLNHVIDAATYKNTLARYANDARGLSKIKGSLNNSKYVKDEGKVYIKAVKDILPDAEILVSYGKEYWDVVINNKKLDYLKIIGSKKQKSKLLD